jgi:hypothetical protein
VVLTEQWFRFWDAFGQLTMGASQPEGREGGGGTRGLCAVFIEQWFSLAL